MGLLIYTDELAVCLWKNLLRSNAPQKNIDSRWQESLGFLHPHCWGQDIQSSRALNRLDLHILKLFCWDVKVEKRKCVSNSACLALFGECLSVKSHISILKYWAQRACVVISAQVTFTCLRYHVAFRIPIKEEVTPLFRELRGSNVRLLCSFSYSTGQNKAGFVHGHMAAGSP